MARGQVYAEKTAIVTGGSSGIGLALARALVERGAHVVLTSRSLDKARSAAAALSSAAAEGVELDVRDRSAFHALATELVARRGAVDYLFNNAGMAVIGELRDHTAQDFDDMIDVNLRGVIHGVAAVYPHMVARRSGHIVNIASVGGLVATPFGAGYTATKFGVVGLSHALRIEAERLGVRVSVVCPAGVDTPMAQNSRFRHLDRVKFLSGSPLPRDSAEHCAQEILRGVESDRAQITPHAAKVLAVLQRYAPWCTRAMMRKMCERAATLREAYQEPAAATERAPGPITLQ